MSPEDKGPEAFLNGERRLLTMKIVRHARTAHLDIFLIEGVSSSSMGTDVTAADLRQLAEFCTAAAAWIETPPPSDRPKLSLIRNE